jgi:hypothetical protein
MGKRREEGPFWSNVSVQYVKTNPEVHNVDSIFLSNLSCSVILKRYQVFQVNTLQTVPCPLVLGRLSGRDKYREEGK